MINIMKYRSEILLAIYMTIFSLIKPILIKNPDKSTLILAILTLMLLGNWLLLEWIYTKKITISLRYLSFILIIYFWLFCEAIFRNNSVIDEIIYKFSIYGAIPILICSKINDYKKLLWLYAIFSIINGLIYFFDPINSYEISGDYMNFGFSQMLPAFTGGIIFLFIFKKKYGVIFAIVFFIQMFLYANKGATICAVCLMAISYIFFNDNKKIVLRRAFIIIILLCIVIFNTDGVCEWLIETIKSLNIETYSLITFLNMLQNNGDKVYHARTDIWESAIQLFNQKTIIGNGIGYFEANFNGYTHNFFLDIAVSSGLIGIIIIMFILVISIKRMIKIHNIYKKFFLMIMFVIAFIPMMFSLTYWTVMPFWIYLAIIFCSKKEEVLGNERRNEDINRKL